MKLLFSKKIYRAVLLILLGAFAILGFAPFYFYPATLVSLLIFCLFCLQCQSSKEAAWCGLMYGLGLFCVGIYWIYISLHTYGGMPSWMATLATFLLCAFMASFTALAIALSFWISKISATKLQTSKTQALHFIVALAIFWGLADWVRSWIFTGFPWLTIGYSQLPFSPLSGYIPIIGVYGVSFLTVFLAGLIAIFIHFWFFEKAKSKYFYRNIIATLFMVWLAGSLLKAVEWSTPIGKPITTALMQGNIAQDLKWSPEHTLSTIDLYLDMIKKSSAQLIILPETALPILSSALDPTVQNQLVLHGRKNQGDIIIGMVQYKADSNEYFNSAFSFGTAKTQQYQKNHLVPFGEFIPLKQVFGWIYRDWLNIPLSDLSRGTSQPKPMLLAGQKIALNICYEDVFGEEIIRQLPEATLLVNISNDAWYGQSYAAAQHMQFSQARALESARMVLRATNTGATAIIDPHGFVMAQAPHFTQTTLNGTAQGYTGATPYVRLGNWPFIFLSFLVLIALFYRKIKAA